MNLSRLLWNYKVCIQLQTVPKGLFIQLMRIQLSKWVSFVHLFRSGSTSSQWRWRRTCLLQSWKPWFWRLVTRLCMMWIVPYTRQCIVTTLLIQGYNLRVEKFGTTDCFAMSQLIYFDILSSRSSFTVHEPLVIPNGVFHGVNYCLVSLYFESIIDEKSKTVTCLG